MDATHDAPVLEDRYRVVARRATVDSVAVADARDERDASAATVLFVGSNAEAIITGALVEGWVEPLHRGDDPAAGAFIVFEPLVGHTLAERLRGEGTSSWRSAARVVDRVLEVLDVAHRAGHVHGDLRPATVIVRSGLPASVLAVVLEPTAPRYLSPERAASGAASPTDDVYAACAMLYELLAGAPPFDDAEDAAERALLVRAGPVRPIGQRVAGVPLPLQSFLARALEREPSARPGDAQATLHALREAVSESAMTMPEGTSTAKHTASGLTVDHTLPTRGRPAPVRGKVRAVSTLVLMGVVAVGGGSLSYWASSGSEDEAARETDVDKAITPGALSPVAGQTVAIHWPEDDHWYPATVTGPGDEPGSVRAVRFVGAPAVETTRWRHDAFRPGLVVESLRRGPDHQTSATIVERLGGSVVLDHGGRRVVTGLASFRADDVPAPSKGARLLSTDLDEPGALVLAYTEANDRYAVAVVRRVDPNGEREVVFLAGFVATLPPSRVRPIELAEDTMVEAFLRDPDGSTRWTPLILREQLLGAVLLEDNNGETRWLASASYFVLP